MTQPSFSPCSARKHWSAAGLGTLRPLPPGHPSGPSFGPGQPQAFRESRAVPWQLNTEFTFDSAHVITGYDGSCGRLHGHTYPVRMELQSGRLRPSEHVARDILLSTSRATLPAA